VANVTSVDSFLAVLRALLAQLWLQGHMGVPGTGGWVGGARGPGASAGTIGETAGDSTGCAAVGTGSTGNGGMPLEGEMPGG
jgi:hypothetical protein